MLVIGEWCSSVWSRDIRNKSPRKWCLYAFNENYLTQKALCDGKGDEGGWTVILKRNTSVSSRVSFTRTWNEYVQGFGDLNSEFWYGLRNIHCLTNRQSVDLKLSLTFTNRTTGFWLIYYTWLFIYWISRSYWDINLYSRASTNFCGWRDVWWNRLPSIFSWRSFPANVLISCFTSCSALSIRLAADIL